MGFIKPRVNLQVSSFESELEISIGNIFLQGDTQQVLEDLDTLYVHEYNQRFCMEVDCLATRDRIHSFNIKFKDLMYKHNLTNGRFNVRFDLDIN